MPDQVRLERALQSADLPFSYEGGDEVWVPVSGATSIPPGVVDGINAAGYEFHELRARMDGATDVVFKASGTGGFL